MKDFLKKYKHQIIAGGGTVLLCVPIAVFGVWHMGQNDIDSKPQSTKSASPSSSSSSSSSPSAPNSGQSTPSSTPSKLPSQVLNLANWKLTLPINTSHSGTPDEIEQPELAGFVNTNFFFVNNSGDGVAFRAYANGVTTKGSNYPRSELREMTNNGTSEAAWSPGSGTHQMVVREAVTHLPDVKRELVAAQIHDDTDDIIMIRLEENRLFVERNGKNIGDLDTAYTLGSIYTVVIRAQGNTVTVDYNGQRKVSVHIEGANFYFKAGCYTQTNETKGDSASSYGEVTIFGLQVNHSA